MYRRRRSPGQEDFSPIVRPALFGEASVVYAATTAEVLGDKNDSLSEARLSIVGEPLIGPEHLRTYTEEMAKAAYEVHEKVRDHRLVSGLGRMALTSTLVRVFFDETIARWSVADQLFANETRAEKPRRVRAYPHGPVETIAATHGVGASPDAVAQLSIDADADRIDVATIQGLLQGGRDVNEIASMTFRLMVPPRVSAERMAFDAHRDLTGIQW